MNWWGSVSLLAVLLPGACGGVVLTHAVVANARATGQLSAGLAAASHAVPRGPGNSGYVLTAASSGPVFATSSAVLSQNRGKGLWQTTVILSQAAGECPGPASNYWLETTSPNRALQASSVTRMGLGPCRVTVTFKGAPRAPQSALLVLDEASALSSVQLTLSRDVTLFDYLGAPAICGVAMTIVLFLLTLRFLIRIREEDGTQKWPTDSRFWARTVPASEIRSVSLIPIATVVATFLGAGTLASSLFPGISLSAFGGLSGVTEGFTAGAGLVVYTFLYERWVRRQAPDVLGSILELPSGDQKQHTIISLPDGADISSDGIINVGRYVADAAKKKKPTTTVPPPDKIKIPQASIVTISQGDFLTFLEGPNIRLTGSCALLVSNKDDDESSLAYGDGGDREDGTVTLPAIIEAEAGTTINYFKQARLVPGDAKVRGPFGRRVGLGTQDFPLTPDHPTDPAVNIFIGIVPVLASIFAIGAELGIIGVLSIWLSDATGIGRFFAFDLIVAIALFVLYYCVSKIRSAANPYSAKRELDGAVRAIGPGGP